jgi:osmoprotectant transport system permease protein
VDEGSDVVNGPLGDMIAYLTDPESWAGTPGLGNRLVEHIGISALALLVATVVAVPLAVWLGHVGRGGVLAVNIGNAARAVPTFALLVLFVMLPDPLGVNTFSFVLALALFALPPLLTNTYVGMREVDRGVVDAARGVGMSGRQVVARVELPLAAPLLMTGVRLAAVQVVATATVLGLVGGGALGRIIASGFANQDQGRILGSAVVVTLLALLTEGAFALLERRVRRRPGRPADDEHESSPAADGAPVPVGT